MSPISTTGCAARKVTRMPNSSDLCALNSILNWSAAAGEISRVGNLEQNARFARYDFLRNAAASLDADGILTAHTINDQAETFLLNLMRGSGTRGLSGMRANSTFKIQDSRFKIQDRNQKSEIGNRKSEITLIRPLLKRMMRKDTENYCRLREIEPRSDAMNEDLSFSRVRVRKILLPLLKEFNPKIVETLARTAELLQLESAEKNALTRENGETEKRFETAEIALNELRNLSKSDIYAILRGWLEFNSGSLRGIELKHIEAVENLIFSRRSGKIAELPNGAAVVKSGGYLSFKNFKVEK